MDRRRRRRRRRRSVLLVGLLAGLVVLTGCTATLDGGESGPSTSSPASPAIDTPVGTPPPTPGECTAVERATVDPFREDVEPSELPDPPGEWTRSSVERYVVAFEEAYARNGALQTATKSVEVSVGDVSVERRGEAWVVELTSRTNTWVQSAPSGNRTATVVHGDGAYVPVTYRLTDRALYRREGTVGGTPSSSGTSTREPQHGPAVECFET